MAAREQYVQELGSLRLRTTIERERRQVISWAVQLEWEDPAEGWIWVARYDTAGSQPHRDQNRMAAHQEVSLSEDPGQVIQAAKADLLVRAEVYIEAYWAAKVRGEEAW